jgi:uncharacterized protein (TIGR03435 family)
MISGTVSAQKPAAFDVATIRPTSPNDFMLGFFREPGGRFVASGYSLRSLMLQAYEVQNNQIVGGPGWINTERWSIQAKADGVSDLIPMDQFRMMLRSLIEDRFQLKSHRETREMPLYELTVDKKSMKLQPSTDDGSAATISVRQGEFSGKKIPMSRLIEVLSQELHRPVVDKTGLTARYDFNFSWTSEVVARSGSPGLSPATVPAVAAERPGIFTAIEEQLGLKLTSARASLEVIVVDNVEKPSDN